jgi:ribosome-associated protein
MNFRDIDFSSEFHFNASRSGGKGGQNVNKVSTKVELAFDVDGSQILTEEQKIRVKEKLASRINAEGILKIVSQADRTQLGNKQIVIKTFFDLLEKAFHREKKRVKSKPTKASKKRRLDGKSKHAEKKALRKKDW